MNRTADIEIQAGRLRAANIFGRSEPLRKLFDFLVAHAGDTQPAREQEVAEAIFRAGDNFDATQDASVRVYIHRLRQRLDDYYADAGRNDLTRLSIPKGVGYRIVSEPHGRAPGENVPVLPQQAQIQSRRLRNLVIFGVATLLILNLAAWAVFVRGAQERDSFAGVRANPVWDRFLSDGRSITLVIGDYYIFGENTDNKGGNRLVREYAINSPTDLDAYLMDHPAMVDRYVDLDLYYLPISAAPALKSIMPILAPNSAARDHIHVIAASDLTADQIKRTNVIYVGYLSGLGILRDIVFSGSRFSVGDTYDELVDNAGKRTYISQEGGPEVPDAKFRDFGYFSTFTGPGGNKIMIIAGTRDIGLMHAAEAVTDRDSLDALTSKAGKSDAYEALYEVEGIKRSNLNGGLVLVSPLRADKIWNSQPSTLRFPNG
jgi:hypothetical protein